MDVLAILGDAARIALRVFIVLAPLLAWQFVVLWWRPFRRRGGGLLDPTIIAGMMLGVAMLAVLLPAGVLTWDAIVTVNGFWDLHTNEFIPLARDMLANGPGALIEAMRVDDVRGNLETWVSAAMGLWLLRLIVVWLSGPPLGNTRFLVAELATLVASALGTVYLGPLLLWSANRLNFWLFLVLVLLIQDLRYDEPPLFSRLLGGLRWKPHHHRPHPGMGMPVPDPD